MNHLSTALLEKKRNSNNSNSNNKQEKGIDNYCQPCTSIKSSTSQDRPTEMKEIWSQFRQYRNRTGL